MLLQSIVERLDTELDRLHTLRNIVSALQRTPPVLEALTPQLVIVEKTAQLPPPQMERPRRRAYSSRTSSAGESRATSRRARVQEPTPLRHAIPTGPIVVSRQQLVQEREHRSAHHGVAEPIPQDCMVSPPDLEGQSRQLASRWIANGAAH